MKAYLSEFVGTALLFSNSGGFGLYGVIQLGSWKCPPALFLEMAWRLGAGLYVLITLLGPLSGAHFKSCCKFNVLEVG
jgi:glycerol uptake facilitator-like aquaporin